MGSEAFSRTTWYGQGVFHLTWSKHGNDSTVMKSTMAESAMRLNGRLEGLKSPFPRLLFNSIVGTLSINRVDHVDIRTPDKRGVSCRSSAEEW